MCGTWGHGDMGALEHGNIMETWGCMGTREHGDIHGNMGGLGESWLKEVQHSFNHGRTKEVQHIFIDALRDRHRNCPDQA